MCWFEPGARSIVLVLYFDIRCGKPENSELKRVLMQKNIDDSCTGLLSCLQTFVLPSTTAVTATLLFKWLPRNMRPTVFSLLRALGELRCTMGRRRRPNSLGISFQAGNRDKSDTCRSQPAFDGEECKEYRQHSSLKPKKNQARVQHAWCTNHVAEAHPRR